MRFLVDECTGPSVSKWLKQNGHDSLSVYDEARGLDDESILEMALKEERILITNDKDFRELVFRDGQNHNGIILLCLMDESIAGKIVVVERLLAQYLESLAGSFVVATEDRVRIIGGGKER